MAAIDTFQACIHCCHLSLFLLEDLGKNILKLAGALLGGPLLAVFIVDEGDAETGFITLGPLEVVHEGPSHIALDVTSVLSDGLSQGVDVATEVVDAELVVEDLFERQIVLALNARPVLRHVYGRISVPLTQPVDQVAEALWVRPQPSRLRLGADDLAMLVDRVSSQVAQEIIWRCFTGSVLDVIGGVVVHTIEVVRPLDERSLLRGKFGKSVAELLTHRIGVSPKVHGIGKPRDSKFYFSIGRNNIFRILRVPWVGPVSVQCDANLALVSGLEFFAVNLHGPAMSHQDIVADCPRLAARITDGRLFPVRSVARCEETSVVAKNRATEGFVKGNPVLALRYCLEYYASVMFEIERKLCPI